MKEVALLLRAALSSDSADQPILCDDSGATTVNRTEFQILADVRLRRIKTLLDNGQWDGAYYLAGYAVECGLKACIAKLTKEFDFPPEKELHAKCYSHDLEKRRRSRVESDKRTERSTRLLGLEVHVTWQEDGTVPGLDGGHFDRPMAGSVRLGRRTPALIPRLKWPSIFV